jgi:hypothetical protein
LVGCNNEPSKSGRSKLSTNCSAGKGPSRPKSSRNRFILNLAEIRGRSWEALLVGKSRTGGPGPEQPLAREFASRFGQVKAPCRQGAGDLARAGISSGVGRLCSLTTGRAIRPGTALLGAEPPTLPSTNWRAVWFREQDPVKLGRSRHPSRSRRRWMPRSGGIIGRSWEALLVDVVGRGDRDSLWRQALRRSLLQFGTGTFHIKVVFMVRAAKATARTGKLELGKSSCSVECGIIVFLTLARGACEREGYIYQQQRNIQATAKDARHYGKRRRAVPLPGDVCGGVGRLDQLTSFGGGGGAIRVSSQGRSLR